MQHKPKLSEHQWRGPIAEAQCLLLSHCWRIAVLSDPAIHGFALCGHRVFVGHKVWPASTFALRVLALILKKKIKNFRTGLLYPLGKLEIGNQPTSQHYVKTVQKWILLTTAWLVYCTSNHQQGHGIHHCSCHKIIPFLQRPHLR